MRISRPKQASPAKKMVVSPMFCSACFFFFFFFFFFCVIFVLFFLHAIVTSFLVSITVFIH